jgi:hypothetical protein
MASKPKALTAWWEKLLDNRQGEFTSVVTLLSGIKMLSPYIYFWKISIHFDDDEKKRVKLH